MKYGIMESFRMHDTQIEYGLKPDGNRKLLLKKAKELGFQGVELGIGLDYREDRLWTGEGTLRQTIKKEAKLTGINVPSLCLHLLNHMEYSLASVRKEHRKLGREILQNSIEACSSIGGTVILMPFFGSAALKSKKKIEFLISEMKKVSHVAEDKGVYLALETSLQAPDVLHIVKSVDSEYVRVYFDTGNAAVGGYDLVQEVETLGKHIVQVHVKDYPEGTLGVGNIDFNEVIGVLKETDFDGYLVLETPALTNSEESAVRNLNFIKQVLEG